MKHICLNCGAEFERKNSKAKYCGHDCQQRHQHKLRVDEWLLNDSKVHKVTIKRYLVETFGDKCSVCSIETWNDKPIVLELEHKDGNSENNRPENLCLICPNCHSQTETFKGKNKGNGRHVRRTRYKEGKSF
jgi:hypothetical protein